MGEISPKVVFHHPYAQNLGPQIKHQKKLVALLVAYISPKSTIIELPKGRAQGIDGLPLRFI